MTAERITLRLDDTSSVTAAVDPGRRRRPGVFLAPGAGGNLDGNGLVALAALFADLGHPVVRANLPHHEAGRRGAPRAERSVEPYRQAVTAAEQAVRASRPWIAGGKSYGGRVASLAVAAGMPARGLVFYGYPLHAPGKPDRLRVDHWPLVGVPCLFLQGTRDPFCYLSLLEPNLRKLPRRATVHVVEGADHSLHITAAASPDGTASSAAATVAGLRPVVADWVASLEH